MTAASLLEALGYKRSRKFILPESHELPANELSFALRRTDQACRALAANGQNCQFRGAYVLQNEPASPAVPIVYLFETETDAVAKEIHRMVWNQNLVPFLIVASPSRVRVYPGFDYSLDQDKSLVSVPASVEAVLGQLAAFTATAIDDGTLWKEWGHAADPLKRVDESLRRNLKDLDRLLQKQGMGRDASHGLIGKFVYLRYLKDRDILSDRKLDKWRIEPDAVFSRDATLNAFHSVNDKLQDWLNGSVFQLGDKALSTITQAQLQLVAGVFFGDEPHGQLTLFKVYDFSHIPIETLSCIYEQFLHDTKDAGGKTRGKRLGAYYTPIPLADYMISELEQKRPLEEGMKVLDPACGSGVFLVQCYRRLIEKKLRAEKRSLKKEELRTLLTEHIFGIDRDDDACRVTELSLILTLLDYVCPPDLENTTFKLPDLRKEGNIFKDDFFDADGVWHSQFGGERFDWVVGNPPWAEVKSDPPPPPEHDHYYVWKWMTDHKSSHPTGGNQIAEAFLWKVGDHLAQTGIAGLLIPAMTWFKKESVAFRRQFFSRREVWCLANFANLIEVLFARRARSPASAVFYRASSPEENHVILSFSPFVAEQIANRPQEPGEQVPTWNIVVNGAEMREVPNRSAAEGAGLAWKSAMWGSSRDARLLDRIQLKCPVVLKRFCRDADLKMHEGAELRESSETQSADLEDRPELVGRLKLDFDRLRGIGRIFTFPPEAQVPIRRQEAYVRKRGGFAGLEVSKPPHLIVDAARRFAVFSIEFLLVPPRQIGIAGPKGSDDLLRALALFLSSDFATYHQFLVSPKWGIDQNLADLDTLKKIPVPIKHLSPADIADWSAVHRELVQLSDKKFAPFGWQESDDARFAALLSEINSRVFKLLALRPHERWLIEDFVHLNMGLKQGTVTQEAMGRPTVNDLRRYLTTLRDCLDSFLSSSQGFRHKIEAITADEYALFSVSLQRTSAPVPPSVFAADQSEARTLLTVRDRLRRKHSQWVYFDRSLKIYDHGVLYQFKPMQRIHWSRRQAILDADEIIAETLTEG